VAPYVELARIGGGRISASMTGEVVARGERSATAGDAVRRWGAPPQSRAVGRWRTGSKEEEEVETEDSVVSEARDGYVGGGRRSCAHPTC
jgi:hypothetical protein